MSTPIDRTNLGCGVVIAVILGLIGFRIYYGHQRMSGLDGLVTRTRTAAAAERVAPALKAAMANAEQTTDVGQAVAGLLAQPLTQEVLLSVPDQPKLFNAPIAIVDLDARRIDATQGRLPWGVRAHGVASARTLVFVRCFKTKVGDYGFQGAFSRTCDLVGFDMQAPGGPMIQAVASFEKEPPQSISSLEFWHAFGDVAPPRPVYEMAGFVKYQLGLAPSPTPG
jgi:hypothetical protein